jgi:hypothetical protein
MPDKSIATLATTILRVPQHDMDNTTLHFTLDCSYLSVIIPATHLRGQERGSAMRYDAIVSSAMTSLISPRRVLDENH